MLAGHVEACALVGLVYCIGASQLDPRLTVLLLLLIVWLLTRTTRHQRERSAKLDRLSSFSTGRGMKQAFSQEMIDMLPSWVTFSDSERADWINTWLHKVWPFINQATEETLKATLNPILARLVKGTPIRHLRFVKFSLGGTPLNITGVRCHSRGSTNEVTLDLDIRLAGRPDVQLDVGVSSYAFCPVMLSELELVGTLRVVFSPLCAEWPCFAGVAFGFLRQPLIDCRLEVASNSFDVMSLPGVSDALKHTISVSLASSCTWPNFISVPILEAYAQDPDFAMTMGLRGLLELQLLGAAGLKRPKANLLPTAVRSAAHSALSLLLSLSPIRPYATVALGGAEAVRSATAAEPRQGSAALGFCSEWVVDQPESDRLTLRLFDDQLSDFLLGTCTLDVASVVRSKGGLLERWLPLGAAPGSPTLHVRALWRAFPSPGSVHSAQPAHGSAERGEEPAQAEAAPEASLARRSLRFGSPVAPAVGVLVVQLHSASGLRALDFGGTSDPYARLAVQGGAGPGERCASKVVSRTCSPRWEERFRLCVRDVEAESLSVSLWDHDLLGPHDPLGQLLLPLAELTSRPHTQATYKLEPPEAQLGKPARPGADYGEVTLSMHWKPLVDRADLEPAEGKESPRQGLLER